MKNSCTKIFLLLIGFFVVSCAQESQKASVTKKGATDAKSAKEQTAAAKKGKKKSLFSSVVFDGASVTAGKGLNESLQARFEKHLVGNIENIKVSKDYKAFRLFVGVDYFFPTVFSELLLEQDTNKLQELIKKRLEDLLQKTPADQYYLGVGPAFTYSLGAAVLAQMHPTAMQGLNLENLQVFAIERFQVLHQTLRDLARNADFQDKVILIDFDEYVVQETETPRKQKSVADENVEHSLVELVGSDGLHPNAKGQAVTLNYVIDNINKHNNIQIPFLSEK